MPEFSTLMERVVYELTGKTLSDRWGKTHCPFHDDRRPSAVWNERSFRCFACGVSGTPVGLLHDILGLEWADAYKRAEELSGTDHSPVPRTTRSGFQLSGQSGNRPRNRRRVSPGIRRRTSDG